ncbi:hypothetical protein ACFQH6_00905 [Halobacteriaceae archaeon GCM10025711]
MTDYSVHEPEFSGTTEADWSAPDEEDFDTGDLGDIDDHFVLSSSGFPPENYTDLKLPVVDPDGNLNRHALQAAKSGGHGVQAIDGLDDDTEQDVKDLIDRLANEHFDADFGE